jgi:hypothetical protein
MLSKQEEEQERREVLENDRKVREQQRGGTFHQYAQSTANDEAGGRFAAVNSVSVVGAEPVVKYPAAAAHQADPVPTEPPTGYDINEMLPLEPSAPPCVEDTGAPAGAAASLGNLPPSTQDECGDAGAPSSPTEESK